MSGTQRAPMEPVYGNGRGPKPAAAAEWLATYVDALSGSPEAAAELLATAQAADAQPLARLAAALQAALVPVSPPAEFRAELNRSLSGSGWAGRPMLAIPSRMSARWVTVAVAGSLVSAIGLAWMWRRWRPAA